MIFQGAKFCSHCGARVDRTEGEAAVSERCPRCRLELKAVTVGRAKLLECEKCEGFWVDAASLDQICADREQQAAVLGMPGSVQPIQSIAMDQAVRYLPCPVCHQLMNRINFAHYSNVVVEVCKAHGTWFDKDELRRIVEFIRGGGLEASRQREIEDLEQRKRELSATRAAGAWDGAMDPSNPRGLFGATRCDDMRLGISAVADLLRSIFR